MDMEHVGENYALSEVEKISTFLNQHPSLETLLDESYHAIKGYFKDSDLRLDLIHDDDAKSDYLLISIVTDVANVDEILQRFDEFRQRKWLAILERADSMLTVDVEFR